MTASIPGAVTQPLGKTTLVTRADVPVVLSANRTTDCRTALTRGLKEYLEQLDVIALGGRQVKFKKVLETWGEPETPSEMPSAVVYSLDAGIYEASNFKPVVSARDRLPDGSYLLKYSEYATSLMVETWINDPKARIDFVAALEDAFDPVDFMGGFRLDLPHYYGARAEFVLQKSAYADNQDDAMHRHRIAQFTLTGRVSKLKPMSYPIAKPKARIEVVENNFDPSLLR
jgi:hypothetical protein